MVFSSSSKRIISLPLALFVSGFPGTDVYGAYAQVFGAGAKAAGSGAFAGSLSGCLRLSLSARSGPALSISGGLAPLSPAASIGVSPFLSAGVVLSAVSIQPSLQRSLSPAAFVEDARKTDLAPPAAEADFDRRAALDAARFDGSRARLIAPPAAIGAMHGVAALDPARLAALPVWEKPERGRADAPKPPALGASAYSGLGLIALAFLIYPLYPFIAVLPLPLAGKVAVGVGAYALSWGLFFAGGYLGGRESWRYLKARLRQ